MSLLPALLVLVAAQSLGDAAVREEARRRAAPRAATRTITNDDLGKARGGTLSVMGVVSRAAPAAAPPAAGSSDAREAAWRIRFADARRRVAEAETRAWVEVIEPVLVGGGGFGGLTTGRAVYVPMKVKKFVETEELREARHDLDALHDELRQAGGLPGWGRE